MSTASIWSSVKSLTALPTTIRYDGSSSGVTRGLDVRAPGDSTRNGDASAVSANPLPQIALSTPPAAPAINNNPTSVMYQGVVSTLTFAGLPAAIAPQYGTPHEAPAMPDGSVDAPPLSYPSAGLLDLAGSAGIALAAKPKLMYGTRPTLINPTLAAFDPQPLAPWAGQLPAYESFELSPLAAPDAIDYLADAALIERIKVTLSGFDVLSDAAQRDLHARLIADVDLEELQGRQAIMSKAAARGFSMPVGFAARQVADLARGTRTKRMDAAYQVRDQTYDAARGLLLDALSQAIALEQKHASLHASYCARLVRVLSFNAQQARELFDNTIALFNASTEAIRLILADYRRYVAAIESQDDAVVAGVKVELAKALTYSNDVQMFGAQIQTVSAIADIESMDAKQQGLLLAEYESYLTGVMANVGIVKSNLEGFRESVRAFGLALDHDASAFDAYADQLSAVVSQAGVTEANVQAYERFWRAEGGRANAYRAYVDDASSVFNAEVREYQEYAGAHRSFLSAQTDRVRAALSGLEAFNAAVRSGAGYTSAYNRAAAEWTGAVNMERLAKASANMNKSALEAQADAESARIEASRLAANANIAAGLSSAALHTTGVNIGLRADAGVDERAGTSSSMSFGHSASRNWTRSHSKGSGG